LQSEDSLLNQEQNSFSMSNNRI